MSDMFLGSQTPLYQNVCIKRRNKNGKILEERFAKNRITRLMLYGIGKFLLGHFNDSTPDKIYEYIPRYLALGTNTVDASNQYSGVTKSSSVNDTRLLNEIITSSTTGKSLNRVYIAERNMCKLNTKFTDSFIKVSIKTYISSTDYDGMSIGEAGLFSKEKDNNCLARVCFPNITKNPGEVLDIQWDITLMSYGQTLYPEKIEIENGSKVVIPLHFTNKQFKEINLDIIRDGIDDNTELSIKDTNITICNILNKQVQNVININNLISTEWYSKYKKIFYPQYEDLENIDTTNLSEEEISEINAKKETINELFKSNISTFLSFLNDAYLDDSNTYFYKDNFALPFYFGNLSYNQSLNEIDSYTLGATLLFTIDQNYSYEETGYTYMESDVSGNYSISSPEDDNTSYKVISNRIYRKYSYNENWEALDYFLYNGIIVDINRNDAGYSYSDNKFYKVTISEDSKYMNEYINYNVVNSSEEELNENYFTIYQINSNNTVEKSNYYVDLRNDNKIYELIDNSFNYTDYHLTSDGWYVTGDYVKLIPILTPSNSTDRDVTWHVQNKDIAKLNFNGVVTAWNLGETTAIVSTTNDLRAKCIINVVKDESYIDIESIDLDPTEVTLLVDGDANQYAIVTGTIYPLFATNSTLKWSLSNDLDDCISKIELGNNQVKLILKGNGNTGSGYLIASSQSGLTAQCLVRVLYSSDYSNDENCDNDYHSFERGRN